MAKKKKRRNSAREERIAMEIIVDAYGPEEQAMGWYSYLDEELREKLIQLVTKDTNEIVLGNIDEIGQKVHAEYSGTHKNKTFPAAMPPRLLKNLK